MAANFIPLQPNTPLPVSAQTHRLDVKILSGAQASQACSPLPTTSNPTPTPPATAPEPAFTPLGNTSSTPQVNLIREGDRIAKIQIRCPCGQTIELACVY